MAELGGGEADGGFLYSAIRVSTLPLCHQTFMSRHQNPLCKLKYLSQSTAVYKLERSKFGFTENLAGEILGGAGVCGICMDEFQELSFCKQKLNIHLPKL